MSDALPVRVAAGGEVRVPITVHNPGDATDHYRCDVLGDPARWSRIEPRHLPGIVGGDRAAVELVLRPPPNTPPGSRPVGVRCVSLQDGSRAGVVDGEVTVGTGQDVEVTATPVAPRGRRAGHYAVEVSNSGAYDVDVGLSATDPRQELGFALAPRDLTVAPGESATAYLSVRPRRPRLGGGPVVHRFSLEHRTGTGPKARLPLTFEQRPVLGGVGTAAVAVLVMALAATAGLLLWPSVRGLLPGGDGTTTGAASGTATSPSPTESATGDPVVGAYVLYGTASVDDTVGKAVLDETLGRLQVAGVPARLVDSRESDVLADGEEGTGFWVVLQDGFPDVAAAKAECDRTGAIAPCSPVAPR